MTGENRKRKEQISSDLEKLVKGEVLADIFNRVAFSTDASIYQIMPVCIVAVLDAEDISAVVKYAARNNIPLAPRGARLRRRGRIAHRRYCHRYLTLHEHYNRY